MPGWNKVKAVEGLKSGGYLYWGVTLIYDRFHKVVVGFPMNLKPLFRQYLKDLSVESLATEMASRRKPSFAPDPWWSTNRARTRSYALWVCSQDAYPNILHNPVSWQLSATLGAAESLSYPDGKPCDALPPFFQIMILQDSD
jgi:hypothetical protein